MITPTPGRVLWYTPHKDDTDFDGFTAPFTAHVAYVHGDRDVNVMVIHPLGDRPRGMQHVPLIQEGDTYPEDGHYVEWMPYQTKQAKKNAAES